MVNFVLPGGLRRNSKKNLSRSSKKNRAQWDTAPRDKVFVNTDVSISCLGFPSDMQRKFRENWYMTVYNLLEARCMRDIFFALGMNEECRLFAKTMNSKGFYFFNNGKPIDPEWKDMPPKLPEGHSIIDEVPPDTYRDGEILPGQEIYYDGQNGIPTIEETKRKMSEKNGKPDLEALRKRITDREVFIKYDREDLQLMYSTAKNKGMTLIEYLREKDFEALDKEIYIQEREKILKEDGELGNARLMMEILFELHALNAKISDLTGVYRRGMRDIGEQVELLSGEDGIRGLRRGVDGLDDTIRRGTYY